MDDNEVFPYGYAKKGEQIKDSRPGSKKVRINGIDALKNGQLIAPFIFTGACNTEVFETWVEHVLLPQLEPGDKVIMDNATFHKSDKTKNLIESAQCELVFLPPRSPELNLIENYWAPLKNAARKLLPQYDRDLFKCIEILYQNNNIGKCFSF